MSKEIVLSKGKVALVDDGDYEMLVATGLRWCINDGYAFNSRLGRMHRHLLKPPAGVMIDHINGDKLDNRRENLRLCTNSQNQANRKLTRGVSKFKGVGWQKTAWGGHWFAKITVNGSVVCLGSHHTDLDAAKAYNEAAVLHFGEFAHLNDLTLEPSTLTASVRRQVNRTSPSGFKGVYRDPARDRWIAQLKYKGVSYIHKRFTTAKEAAMAYDTVAREVHGSNAITNF